MSTGRSSQMIGWTVLVFAVAVALWLLFGKGKQVMTSVTVSLKPYGPALPVMTNEWAKIMLADPSTFEAPKSNGCAPGFSMVDSGDGQTFWCVRNDVISGDYSAIYNQTTGFVS